MDKADIVTGQYVRITQHVANVGDRMLARGADYLIIFLFCLFACFLFFVPAFLPLHIAGFVVIFIFSTFYSLIFETLWRGQTLGKRWRHLRVVSIDGSRPTFGQLLMRWMFLVVDVWISLIGILPIALSRRHQRFGDMAAGTIVVREEDIVSRWAGTLNDYGYLEDGYQPVYAQAQQLSPAQADVINRALYATDDYDYVQLDTLGNKVARTLHVKPKDGNVIRFLSTILKDYQYYSLQIV